jgi:hypothetical protein
MPVPLIAAVVDGCAPEGPAPGATTDVVGVKLGGPCALSDDAAALVGFGPVNMLFVAAPAAPELAACGVVASRPAAS